MKTGLILVLAFGASDAFHLKFPERLRPKVSSSALAANGIASTDSARAKKTSAFTDWSTGNAIQLGGIGVSAGEVAGGLGLVAINDLKPGDIVVQVPTKMVLSVQSPGEYNRGARELFDDKSAYKDAPWWAQLSVQLNRYDKVNSKDMDSEIDMKGWLDSLPRKFDTPIHWSDDILAELQYDYLSDSVLTQRRQWAEQYQKIIKGAGPTSPLNVMEYADFVWGAETARSRAFSGSYSGSAFNPLPYGLTLFLVSAYVGLNLGPLEQAANGAALVVCASILQDFVFPKLAKTKKYVICPFIDMANHKGTGERGNVAFEYFSDAYSLSVKDRPVPSGSELFISYGPRSNDQLLQSYGFVEPNNAHDVYIMPPLRSWDISALEEACGRKFSSGRLTKLEKAGLLGFVETDSTDNDDGAANRAGGVVVSRTGGVDPSIMQALRALVATDDEWEDAGEAIGNFAAELSGGEVTERLAKLAARTALEMELASKPTALEEDREILRKMDSRGIDATYKDKLAVTFRMEKKKVLEEAIARLG